MKMSDLQVYAKFAVQILGAVLVAVLPLLVGTSPMGASEWMNVALVGVGAFLVWSSKNEPGWNYAKFYASLAITALTDINSILPGPLTSSELLQIGLSLFTSLSVVMVANKVPVPAILQSNMNPEIEQPV